MLGVAELVVNPPTAIQVIINGSGGALSRHRRPEAPLDNQRPAQLRLTSIFTMAKLIVAVLLSLPLARVLAGGRLLFVW